MNIVQLHNRVRFWVDETSSARFDSIDIDEALNIAVSDLIEELSDSKKPNHRMTFLQSDEKTRQKLKPFISSENFSGVDLSGNNVLLSAFPSDFNFQLSLEAEDTDGNSYIVYPTDYNSEDRIAKNPYLRSKVSMNRAYYNEDDTNLRILLPTGKELSSVNLVYFKKPTTIKYGISYTSSKNFTASDVVIAESEEVVYDSTTYLIGEEITIVAGTLNITSGTVVFEYTNTNIGELAHDELAKKAAENLLRSVDEHEKTEYIKKDNMSN